MTRRDELYEQFIEFHTARPEVWTMFDARGLQHAKTRTHYSGKAIMEEIRYQMRLQYGERTFKINDKFTAFYVRLFLVVHPELGDFLSIRRQRSADWEPTGNDEDSPDPQMTFEEFRNHDAELFAKLTLLAKTLPKNGRHP